MNFVNSIFSENLTNAIGWTIVHSIWEGIIIGLILFIVLLFISDNKSRLRYNISVSAFSLLFLLTIINLVAELLVTSGMSETALSVLQSKTVINNANAAGTQAESNSAGFILLSVLSTIGLYLQTNLAMLVTIWLGGLLFFVTRFLGGFSCVKRMKYMDSGFVPAKWQNKLNSFRYKLKITKPVRLLESAKVNVPVVIGYIKPVILIPVGMLTGFPAKEIEAILVHELAHVARNDYLVNILQSIGEIIFFYNPALLWISSTIRAEREKCCDDMAVSICGDSIVFARALANLEEIKTEKYNLALAINGKQNLVSRIKRLFNTKKGTTMIEKTFAAGIIGIMLFTATVFASTLNSNGILSLENEVKTIEKTNTEPNPTSSNDKNRTKPETKETSDLSQVLNVIEPGLVLLDDSLETDGSIVRTRKLTPEEEKLMQKEEERMRIEEKKMRKEEEKMRIEEKKMRKEEEKMRIEEKKMRKEEVKMRIDEKKMRKEEEKMRIEEKKMRKEEEKMRIEEKKMRKKEEKMRKIEAEFMSKLTGLLVKKGIITEGEDFSLKLNQNELYVNGSKQSDGLHQKVKQIYEKARGKELDSNSSFEITQETHD